MKEGIGEITLRFRGMWGYSCYQNWTHRKKRDEIVKITKNLAFWSCWIWDGTVEKWLFGNHYDLVVAGENNMILKREKVRERKLLF